MSKPIIIYVPGLLSTGYLHSLSLKARMFFLRRGYEFRVVHASPAGSIEERSEPIKQLIKQAYFDRESSKIIHIVSHSMACLSSRYYLSQHYNCFVKTCTMISGPHHGSIFADKYVKDPILKPDDNDFEQAYKQLTSIYLEHWNQLYPDNPQVKYFSLGFTNDVMVTPESARWGTYLGTGDCSHLMQTSPWFGGQFSKTFQIVLDNLDSL